MKQTYRKPTMVVAETGMQCALCVMSSEKPEPVNAIPVGGYSKNSFF